MPQENGLSVHQMCQAVQSLGLSPYLLDVTKVNRSTLKGYLHSAVLSGLAPILIIEQVKFDSKRQPWYPDVWHAVTVSGMKVKKNHVANVVGRQTGNDIDSLAGDLDAIYVNDDNLSPYFRVNIGGSADVHLEFEELDDNGRVKETNYWRPSHILIPMHSKIRLGFKELYELAIAISRRLIASKAAYRTMYALQLTSTVQFTTSIKRSSDYLQQLLVGSYRLSSAGFDQFCEEIGLSRYVGIIRLIDKSCGVIEIVVDTTNIPTNPNYLGIICRATNSGFAADVCKTLSHQLGTRGNPCKIIFDLQAGLSI